MQYLTKMKSVLGAEFKRTKCFFFDSLTGRIGEKSDPYLVQMGKSYFNRKTPTVFYLKINTPTDLTVKIK